MSIRYPSSRQRGMMLLEVMIGILIFAVGVLGMVKLRAVSTANSINSEDRTTAALLANDLISELWVARSATAPPDYAAWQKRVWDPTTNRGALPGGTGSLTNGTGASANVATITITWPRKLGRNVDSGEKTSDSNATATYSTQVVIQ